MARLIEGECSLDDLVGETIDDYTITRDDVENALRPAYAYVDALLDTPGAEYYLEAARRVSRPSPAPSAPPISSFASATSSTSSISNSAAGVRVLALYPDGDEDVINAQLLFYAAAARHSFPEFFAGVEDIVLTILQPHVDRARRRDGLDRHGDARRAR